MPELLCARGPTPLDRGARTITKIHRLLLEAATPYARQIRRSDPQAALDTAARAILGACFHDSVRPDPATGEAARHQYADELSDMAIAYSSPPTAAAPPAPEPSTAPRGRGAALQQRRSLSAIRTAE